VIAIGAQTNFDYAEPVTTKHISSNPHVDNQSDERVIEQENDETEKQQSSFAEILAGLLNGVNQSADVSKIDTGEASVNLEGLGNDNPQSDFDLSDIALSEENENILLSAQSGLDDQLLAGFFDEMQAGLAGEDALLKQRALSEIAANEEAGKLAAKKNVSSINKNEKIDTDLSAQSIAKSMSELSASAAKGSEEALAAENAAKKNRAALENSDQNLSKLEKLMSDNAHAVASAKKSGEENASRKEEPSLREGKLDELRSRSRKDKISFDIRDQRTTTETTSRSFMSVEAAAGKMTDTPSVKDITLELRLPDYNNAGQASQTTWETKAASAMENMLARELHNNFNGDIVRHASIALRDGGESVIRLALRPDSLGNVKIRLEMTDNKITGIIFVESEEALNAFRKELAALEQAFKDAGFADANLDLSLSHNEEGRNGNQEQNENVFSPRLAASSYEEALREIELNTEAMMDALLDGGRQGSINMLA